jgi:hypothetical protein
MSEENTAGIQPKATVQFTLHVHLDDGTVKDIPCTGVIESIQQEQKGNENGNHSPS